MKSQHIHLKYRKDRKFKYYRLYSQIEIDFPSIIKIEETIFNGRMKSYFILRGNSGKWDKKILSGLMQIDFRPFWYYGDHIVEGVKNYFILRIHENWELVEIYYFPDFYPNDIIRTPFNYQFLYETKRARN